MRDIDKDWADGARYRSPYRFFRKIFSGENADGMDDSATPTELEERIIDSAITLLTKSVIDVYSERFRELGKLNMETCLRWHKVFDELFSDLQGFEGFIKDDSFHKDFSIREGDTVFKGKFAYDYAVRVRGQIYMRVLSYVDWEIYRNLSEIYKSVIKLIQCNHAIIDTLYDYNRRVRRMLSGRYKPEELFKMKNDMENDNNIQDIMPFLKSLDLGLYMGFANLAYASKNLHLFHWATRIKFIHYTLKKEVVTIEDIWYRVEEAPTYKAYTIKSLKAKKYKRSANRNK